MADRTLDPIEIATYGPVAQALHWLVAALAIAVVLLGWSMLGAPRESGSRDLLLLLHRSIGLLILLMMLVRLLWRRLHPPPPLPVEFPRLEAFAAHVDHALLYILFIAMPVSGYLNAAAAGHSVSLFGLAVIPPLIGTDERLSQIAIALHLAGQFAIYALVGLHVAAALMHRFIRRNSILERMLPLPRRLRR
jgi:cytochrome b561